MDPVTTTTCPTTNVGPPPTLSSPTPPPIMSSPTPPPPPSATNNDNDNDSNVSINNKSSHAHNSKFLDTKFVEEGKQISKVFKERMDLLQKAIHIKHHKDQPLSPLHHQQHILDDSALGLREDEKEPVVKQQHQQQQPQPQPQMAFYQHQQCHPYPYHRYQLHPFPQQQEYYPVGGYPQVYSPCTCGSHHMFPQQQSPLSFGAFSAQQVYSDSHSPSPMFQSTPSSRFSNNTNSGISNTNSMSTIGAKSLSTTSLTNQQATAIFAQGSPQRPNAQLDNPGNDLTTVYLPMHIRREHLQGVKCAPDHSSCMVVLDGSFCKVHIPAAALEHMWMTSKQTHGKGPTAIPMSPIAMAVPAHRTATPTTTTTTPPPITAAAAAAAAMNKRAKLAPQFRQTPSPLSICVDHRTFDAVTASDQICTSPPPHPTTLLPATMTNATTNSVTNAATTDSAANVTAPTTTTNGTAPTNNTNTNNSTTNTTTSTSTYPTAIIDGGDEDIVTVRTTSGQTFVVRVGDGWVQLRRKLFDLDIAPSEISRIKRIHRTLQQRISARKMRTVRTAALAFVQSHHSQSAQSDVVPTLSQNQPEQDSSSISARQCALTTSVNSTESSSSKKRKLSLIDSGDGCEPEIDECDVSSSSASLPSSVGICDQEERSCGNSKHHSVSLSRHISVDGAHDDDDEEEILTIVE